MTTLWAVQSFFASLRRPRSILHSGAKQVTVRATKSLVAVLLGTLLVCGPFSPANAQNAAQNPPSSPTPQTAVAPPSASSQPPVASLGLAKHNFRNAPHPFPEIWKPYQQIQVEQPFLTNSPRLDDLIHEGKLTISLQDAIELALENSLDIAVQRYYPWIADAGILKTKAGAVGYATPGSNLTGSTANLASFDYDPMLVSSLSVSHATTPVNNPFISGTGGTTLVNLASHSTIFDNTFSRGFETGTNVTASWNNTRSSSSSAANFFNPVVQSNLTVAFSQALLAGRGIAVNTRNIRIAKTNRQIADWAFAQQAITTITNTINAYWELVYARANVKVDEQAVTVSQKLYSDNKKQFEAGTMSPLDVTQAASEVATDRQNLIVAQTVQLQDEQILKNAIAKDPMAANLINVEIITTDQPSQPAIIENPSFEDSIKEAFAKRPELQEQVLNIKNADIDLQATRNALLPSLTLTAQYSSIGLAGNSPARGIQQGFGTTQNQVFHNTFPDYVGQLLLTLPFRNRAAQADNVRALLSERQQETMMQQLRNAALLDVRNTYIALTQDRAQVDAASQARALQQQTFEAEQKKYRLGASTVYNVILIQRDLIAAQGTELRALANLEEAKANYERALGRTLEVSHVTIADAKTGQFERETLIPGTLHGAVIGTDGLFGDTHSR
ncbi:MAG TPA: TolC family protein [Candidatus Methylomirabilis sp.]|nr:TolC family protein [Candidatus Methylomirabilis sp.]